MLVVMVILMVSAMGSRPVAAEDEDAVVVRVRPREGRTVYHMHVHKCGGTAMCKEAIDRGEVIPRPSANCNGPGDGVVRRKGPGGLYNRDWSCQDRLTRFRQDGVTYFQSESVFSPQNTACEDQVQLAITLRKPVERCISHIRFEHQFLKDGIPHFRNASFHNEPREDPRHGSAVLNNIYIRTLLGADAWQLPLGAINRTHLHAAQRVLQHFVVFLLGEEVQNAALARCYLDWNVRGTAAAAAAADATDQSKRINRTSGSAQAFIQRRMDKAWFERLRELNTLDQELFLYAQALARAQLARC